MMEKMINAGSFEQALALSHKLSSIGVMANPFQANLGELKIIAWSAELMAKADSVIAENI